MPNSVGVERYTDANQLCTQLLRVDTIYRSKMTDHDNDHGTVLIVEDETALLDSYARILGMRYDVETAADGETALETVDHDTDVVMLDRRLPDTSGEELLMALRDSEYDCQAIYCSAVVPGMDLVDLPPDGYVHKPVGTEGLFDAIDDQLAIADRALEVREYFGLERVRQTLEETHAFSELQNREEYQKLLDRIEAKEQQLTGEQSRPRISPAD